MRPNIEYHDKLLLGEDLYLIDPNNSRLQEVNHPKNIIPYSQMIDSIENYSFSYNKSDKCFAPKSSIGHNNQGNYVTVTIPKVILGLKHPCSLRGNDQINHFGSIQERGFQLLGLRYAERVLGITPRIKVGQQDYYFKIKENTLGLSLVNPDIQLDLLPQIKTAQGTYFEALYNRSSQLLINMKPLLNTSYQGHYWARIPDPKSMDPVGAALLEGKPAYSYINQYPLHHSKMDMYQDRQATIIVNHAEEEYIRKLLKAKADFIAELKGSVKTDLPIEKNPEIKINWLPCSETESKDRVSRQKKLGL